MSKQGQDVATPTRTSNRLAGKRKHHGKPGCPCCTKDTTVVSKKQKSTSSTSTALKSPKADTRARKKAKGATSSEGETRVVTSGKTGRVEEGTRKKEIRPGRQHPERANSPKQCADMKHVSEGTDQRLTEPATHSQGQRKLFMSVMVELVPEMLSDLETAGCDWRREVESRPGLELVTRDGRTLITSDNVATIMDVQSQLQKVLDEKSPAKGAGDSDKMPLQKKAAGAEDNSSTLVNSDLVLEVDAEVSSSDDGTNNLPSKSSKRQSNRKLGKCNKNPSKTKGENQVDDETAGSTHTTHEPTRTALIEGSTPDTIARVMPKVKIPQGQTTGTKSQKFLVIESRPASQMVFDEDGSSQLTFQDKAENISTRENPVESSNSSRAKTGDVSESTQQIPRNTTPIAKYDTVLQEDTVPSESEVPTNESRPLDGLINWQHHETAGIKSQAQDILESLTRPSSHIVEDCGLEDEIGVEMDNAIKPEENVNKKTPAPVVVKSESEESIKQEDDMAVYQALVSGIIKEFKLETNEKKASTSMSNKLEIDDKRHSSSTPINKSGKDANEHTCGICNAYTGTKSGLLAHKNRHHSGTVYRCDICRRPFGYKRECIRHRLTHCETEQKKRLLKLMKTKPGLKDEYPDVEFVQHLNMDKVSDNLAKSGRATMISDPTKATHACKFCEYRGTKPGLRSHLQRYHPKKLVICDVCGASFGTQQQLKIHMAKHIERERQEIEDLELDPFDAVGEDVSNKNPFQIPEDFKSIHKCDLCEYKSTKSGVRQHKERHHREKTLECDICKKRFGRKCDLNTHRTRHFDTEGNVRPLRLPPEVHEVEDSVADGKTSKYSTLHTCDICGYRSTFFGIKSHKRREHTEKRYECNICLKKFIDRYSMTKHRASHFTRTGELKPWMKTTSSVDPEWSCFRCPECPSEFPTKRACDVHVAKAHPSAKDYMCDHCLFTARTKVEIHKHVTRKHEEHTFKCDLCDKTYAFQHDLQFHVNTVHEQTEQCKCDICGKEFTALKYLKIHIQRHEKKFRCYCPVCNKGFMAKARMNEHMETHKPDEERTMNHCCEICGKKFMRKSTMLQHMDGHLGNRPHQCNICHKAFTLPQTLSRHKKIHADKKPYTCQFGRCGKTFLDKTSYECHLVVHTGCSKHKCDTCGKRFTQAATLRRHKCKKVALQKVVELITGQDNLADEQKTATVEIDPNLSQQESQELISILNPPLLNSHQNIVIKTENENNLVFQGSNHEVLVVVNEAPQVEVTNDEQLDTADQGINSYMCSVCEQLFATWEEIQNHMQLHIDSEVSGTEVVEEVPVENPNVGVMESVLEVESSMECVDSDVTESILKVAPSVESGDFSVTETMLVPEGCELVSGHQVLDESDTRMVIQETDVDGPRDLTASVHIENENSRPEGGL